MLLKCKDAKFLEFSLCLYRIFLTSKITMQFFSVYIFGTDHHGTIKVLMKNSTSWERRKIGVVYSSHFMKGHHCIVLYISCISLNPELERAACHFIASLTLQNQCSRKRSFSESCLVPIIVIVTVIKIGGKHCFHFYLNVFWGTQCT